MARGKLDIKIRLERQDKRIIQLAKQLEEAKDKYEELLNEKEDEDMKKLYVAYKKSKRSMDEILALMKGKADI